MTTEEKNKECEEKSNIRDLGRYSHPPYEMGVMSEWTRLEPEGEIMISGKEEFKAGKEPWSVKEKLKQCLNHQHCQWFAGCAKDMNGGPISGYVLSHPDLCFNCNYWMELIDKINDPEIYSIRIEGRHYQTHKNSLFRRPGKYNGFGGRLFIIQLHPTEPNTDGTLIRTYNLWTQGTIPDYFRDRLPDNASFVNEVTETVVFDGQDFITAFDVKAA